MRFYRGLLIGLAICMPLEAAVIVLLVLHFT